MAADEISQYLQSLERENSYRVDCVLKQSETETTQRVFYRLPNGSERGPYIRKYIGRDSGMGNVYRRIFEANQNGAHFAHIPHVLEFYRSDHATVVVMEHVNGPTLADVVYERDPSVALAAELFPALCDAVSELHESFDPPIIHRDLKPSNVIVRNGTPVIIDFGIAREFCENGETDTTHLGTQAYAPPEQFGYEQTTVRSDVYALGMLLYFLLVEQTPSHKALRKGFSNERIPEDLRQVIVKATAFDPQQRYASAAELKAAFLGKFAKKATPEEIAAATGGGVDVPEGFFASSLAQDAAPAVAQAFVSAFEQMQRLQQEQQAASAPPHMPAGNSAEPANVNRIPSGPPPSTAPTAQNQPGKGRLRNIVVLLVFALFVAVSWVDAIDPTRVSTSYPAPYHQYMYLLAVPAVFAFCAYAALDKNRLQQRYPGIPWVRGRTAVLLCVALFILLMIGSYFTGRMAGVF